MDQEIEQSNSKCLNITNSTRNLREKMRIYSQQLREQVRRENTDSLRFGLNEIQEKINDIENLSEKDVEGLAKRIKRRKHASKDDMYRLSHSFIQSLNNIKTFAMIPGAIQILIKELTGPNIDKQMYAAECFCNLSLGEAPLCEKLASMVGSYLVTFLDSNELQIKRLSLWTIANILATSNKGSKNLLQMELWSKLWSLYTEDSKLDDIMEFAGVSLSLILEKCPEIIRIEDLLHLKNNFHTKDPTTSGFEYHLSILFHSNMFSFEEIQVMEEKLIIYLINCSIRNIKEVSSFENFSDNIRVIYSIRILGNLFACRTNFYTLFLHQLSHIWQDNLLNFLNKLFGFRETNITRESLWLLNNIFQDSKNEHVLNICCPLDKLRIYNSLALM